MYLVALLYCLQLPWFFLLYVNYVNFVRCFSELLYIDCNFTPCFMSRMLCIYSKRFLFLVSPFVCKYADFWGKTCQRYFCWYMFLGIASFRSLNVHNCSLFLVLYWWRHRVYSLGFSVLFDLKYVQISAFVSIDNAFRLGVFCFIWQCFLVNY